jgi:hypothetical protein
MGSQSTRAWDAQMKDISEKNFGVVIAFLLPGFLFLWGLSYSCDEVASWLAKSGGKDSPTIAGFLYSTLASLAVGLLISAVRWVLIDHIHKYTGVRDPGMKFANLKDKDRLAGFTGAVENHYRYYQYYANTFVALVGAFAIYVVAGKEPSAAIWATAIGIAVALFFGSRDALKKYYSRASKILSDRREEDCK